MPLIIAHSGSDGKKANSWEFIQFFLEKGLSLEVDVRKTVEGELVLAHDPLMAHKNYIQLKDVFAEIAKSQKSVYINCDLKEAGLEREIFQLAQRYQLWAKIILSGKVELLYAQKWGKQVFYNIENHWEERYLASLTESMLIEGLKELATTVEVINIEESWLTTTIFEVGEQLGLKFSVWTVSDLECFKHFVKLGVYNITSRRAWAYSNWLKGDRNEVFKFEAPLP